MSKILKKTNRKLVKNKITAKSARHNFKIDFFSNSTERTPQIETVEPEPPVEKPVADKQAPSLRELLRNEQDFERIKDDSEKFFKTLENYDKNPDFSEVVVLDEGSLCDMNSLPKANFHKLVPIATRKGVSSYGMILIGPNSVYGPLINTRGTMVIIFIEVENGMVFFESLNSIKKKRTRCKKQIQVLVIPDEVFVIHNESTSVTARLIAISCTKKWKNFDNLRFKEVVALG